MPPKAKIPQTMAISNHQVFIFRFISGVILLVEMVKKIKV
jgi:hypothetical protein